MLLVPRDEGESLSTILGNIPDGFYQIPRFELPEMLWEAAFDRRDHTLFELLDIDETYDFLAMVGSENSIGNHAAQDQRVPVTKLWHLASEIRRTGGVGPVLAWLKSRAYLPQEGRDYKILQIPIEIGKWRSTWYGIDYWHEESG